MLSRAYEAIFGVKHFVLIRLEGFLSYLCALDIQTQYCFRTNGQLIEGHVRIVESL